MQNKRKSISACIIAKNEESIIRDCLASVREVCDEIIFVDTGSADKTKDIALQFTEKVYDFPWQDDFSAARNFALSKATGDLILSIDADERLTTPELLSKIAESDTNSVGGWLIRVSSDAVRADGSTDSYVSNLLRLFINHQDIRFSGIIHETIQHSIIEAGYKIQNTPIAIRHIGYSHSLEKMQMKQERNLKLLNKQIELTPDNPYFIYQRAKTYLAMGNLEAAEQDFETAVMNAPPNGTVKPQALNFAAVNAFKSGNTDLALSRALESLELVPNQAFAAFIAAEVHFQKGDYYKALDYYKFVESAQNTQDLKANIIGDYHLPLNQLANKMGRCLLALREYDKAEAVFSLGLKHNMNDVMNLTGLANALFKKRQFIDAKTLLIKAEILMPDDKEIKGFIKQVDRYIFSGTKQSSQRFTENIEKDRKLLSLAMIVKNEEEMLPECLENVKNAVDEMIVVDTGSSDKTKEIAARYGAYIFDFEWIDDFSAARNEAIKHCTCEWILYLDADERLGEESLELIRALLENAPENVGGYYCIIESEHTKLDGSSELHRGGYARLFRNYGYPAIEFKGRVHEQITPSIFKLNKTIPYSDITIRHLGYNQPREVMESKVKRNYKMLLQHVKDEPLNGYAWFQLGQTLGRMKLNKEAEIAIRFAIDTGTLSDSVLASAYCTMSQMAGNKKKFEEALDWAEKSLEIAPVQNYGLSLKGYSLYYLERYKEAKECFDHVKAMLQSKTAMPLSGFDIILSEKELNSVMEKLDKKLY